MAKTFDITRDIIAVIVIIGAIASLFYEMNPTGTELLRVISGIVVGYYFGTKQVPMGGILTRVK